MKIIEKYSQPITNGLESFRKAWRLLSKQQRGDTIMFQGLKYKIEDVKEDYDGKGQNLYTLCRMVSEDGVTLTLSCLKVLAHEDELQ